MPSRVLPALLALLLAGASCARGTPAPPEPSPTPSPPEGQSEVQRLPPTVAAPELATEPEPGTEKGARGFVTAFMQARMARDERQARSSLSAIARDQYERGEGGLSLAGADAPFTGWEFVSVRAADANAFEVQVKIRERTGRRAETSFIETLFVGPGPDAAGQQRPWVIRGVKRGNGPASP